MAEDDIFYMHFLKPSMEGDSVANWPIVKAISKISSDLIDSGIVSSHLNEALPASSQQDFYDIQSQVEECAEILNVEPPQLFLKQSPEVNAYVTKLKAPHYLVITSGLYDLYKNKPRELRFIIGHELGHLKCKHLEAHAVARFFVGALSGGKGKGVRKKYVAPLLVSQLLKWNRVGEFSADRAGLICLGVENPDSLATAQQALLRLLHGTGKHVDPEQYISDVISFEESEPFVSIRRKFQARSSTHPFVSDRCVALREWVRTRGYSSAIERNSQVTGRVVIDDISVFGLPQSDTGALGAEECDPYIVVSNGDFRHKSKVFENSASPLVENVRWQFPFHDGLRLMFEVRDYDGTSSDDLIGGVAIPIAKHKSETEPTKLRLFTSKKKDEKIPAEIVVSYHIVE